jgi:hypothetical protein
MKRELTVLLEDDEVVVTVRRSDITVLRDALIDASLALRTGANDAVISEERFLALDISDMRRKRYLALRDYASRLKEFCQ